MQTTTPDPDLIVERIVRRVARIEDCDPMDLPVLYDRVNPEAVGELVESAPHEAGFSVTFLYAGYRVTVDGTGRIRVGEVDSPPSGAAGRSSQP